MDEKHFDRPLVHYGFMLPGADHQLGGEPLEMYRDDGNVSLVGTETGLHVAHKPGAPRWMSTHEEFERAFAVIREQSEQIASMSDQIGNLIGERDKLLEELDALRPKSPPVAPSNPWGKRHDGRAPDWHEEGK